MSLPKDFDIDSLIEDYQEAKEPLHAGPVVPGTGGKRLGQIPGLRTSLLYGFGAGFFGGIGYFLYANCAKRAPLVAVISFCSGTLAHNIWTDFHEADQKRLMRQLEFAVSDSFDPDSIPSGIDVTVPTREEKGAQ